MATWIFYIDYQQGGGWEIITPYIDYETFTGKVETLWNNLKPVANTLTFQIKGSSSIAQNFLAYDESIKVKVKKDGVDYFTGQLRYDSKINITHKMESLRVECIDGYAELQARVYSSFQWVDHKVCDTSTPNNSVLHKLLNLAGIDNSRIVVSDIDITIDYFVVEENMKEIPWGNQIEYPPELAKYDRKIGVGRGGDTYLNLVSNLLFQFGYTFNFNKVNRFNIIELFPADVSTGNTFTNLAKNIQKKRVPYDGVDIRWYSVELLEDNPFARQMLFQEISNPQTVTKCLVELAAGEHYPPGADSDDVYVDFEVGGKEVIGVQSASLEWAKSSVDIVQNTFSYSARRAELDFENTGGSTQYIKKFDIVGNVVVKDQDHISKVRNNAGERIFELKSDLIRSQTDADYLASGIAGYYQNSNIQGTVVSTTDYDLGDFVNIIENDVITLDIDCIITQKRYNEKTGEFIYLCEKIANYSAGSVNNVRSYRGVPGINKNQVGFMDETLLLQENYLLVGFDGTDFSSPSVSNKAIYIQDNAFKLAIHSGAAWAVNHTLTFATDALTSNTNFSAVDGAFSGIVGITGALTAASLDAGAGLIKTTGDLTVGGTVDIIGALTAASMDAGAGLIKTTGNFECDDATMTGTLIGQAGLFYNSVLYYNPVGGGTIESPANNDERFRSAAFALRKQLYTAGWGTESQMLWNSTDITSSVKFVATALNAGAGLIETTGDLAVGSDANITGDIYAANLFSSSTVQAGLDITSGGQVRINGGSRMYAYHNTGQSIPSNTITPITWDGFTVDNLGEFTPAGFVPVQPGHYMVWASIKNAIRQFLGGQYLYLYLFRYPDTTTPVAILDQIINITTGNREFMLGGSSPVYIGVGQYIYIAALQNTTFGGGAMTLSLNAYENRFTVFRHQ